MEMQIRGLLQEVLSNNLADGKIQIERCFSIIERLSNKELSNSPDTISSDIYVLCCEAALAVNRRDIASKCLQLFFSRTIQMNQFVCRAYICQAQLIAPVDEADPMKFEEAAAYLLKATSIAKNNPKYYFLIYNASLTYWSLARPLMRAGYKRFLSRSLGEITRSLEGIDDHDYDWRCQLFLLLAESHLDGGRKLEATTASLSCLQLARLHVPKRLFELLRFVVKYNLFDHQKFNREIKTSQSLALVYGLCRLKNNLESPVERQERSSKTPRHTDSSVDKASETPDAVSTTDSATHADVYHTVDEIAKIATALFEQKSYLPPSFPPFTDTKVEMPRETRKHEKDRKSKSSSKTSITETNSAEDERVSLLLEFSRICLDYGFLEYVKNAISLSKQVGISNADLSMKMAFIECEYKVKRLGEKQLTYSKTVVETRTESIRQCVETLATSQRNASVESATIEGGACVLWNLCLPICQPPFYSIVRRPLVAAIEALNSIGSLELRIMAQIEFMLAKCEEDVEQNATALERLERALTMDEASGGLHSTLLKASITRLRLKTELYHKPEKVEDQATMILEQCKSVSDSALSFADRRTLFVQVGNILAPEDFVMVVGIEADAMNVVNDRKGTETASPVRVRGATARSYSGSLMKIKAYGSKQVGAENFAERLRLWVDLCKASRKHEVWDVCRAAARFALVYDDDRISVSAFSPRKPKYSKQSKNVTPHLSEDSYSPGLTETSMTAGDELLEDHPSFPTKEEINAFSNRELLRLIAEVRQILGESLVQLSKCHGCELYQTPELSDDMARKHLKYFPDSLPPSEDADWIEYVKWMSDIYDEAVACFLRSGEHAKSLMEPTLAINAGVLLWNYSTHLIASNTHRQIVAKYETALKYLRSLGHERSTGLVVDLCMAIATAYIKTWAPPPRAPILVEPEGYEKPQDPTEVVQPTVGKTGRKGADSEKTAKTPTAVKPDAPLPAEAISDLKKSLEVLEFGLSLTDGHNPADAIPIGGRLPLIRTWIGVKQMLQQSLPRHLLPDRDLPESHQCHTYQLQSRAICAVEVIRVYSLQQPGQQQSFKDAVTLVKTIQMVDACDWKDPILRLEIYTQLARFCTMPNLSPSGPDHATAVRCANVALKTPTVRATPMSGLSTAEANLRCQAALVYGDSLIRSEGVEVATRLNSCKAFCDAARYAAMAQDDQAATTAMRQFWNNAISFFRSSSGRKGVRSLVAELLGHVKVASKLADLALKKSSEEDLETEDDENTRTAVTAAAPSRNGPVESQIEGPDDLTIRVSLFALIFQSYLDEGQYEECLKILDKALAELPRTKHRLLLFKHRIMTKARLGVSVKMIMIDIHRFKAESEEQVAEMWKKVALSTINARDQFHCYQNAIETLQNPAHNWMKAELYLETAQMLHFHDRPIETIIPHVLAAIDLAMRTATEKPTLQNVRASNVKGKPKPIRKPKKEVDTASQLSKKSVEELELQDITNIRLLEVLLRSFTVLAVVTQRGGSSQQEHANYCLSAQGIVCRIIQVLVESTAVAAREISKAKAAEEKERAKSPKAERKGKDGNVAEAVEKPKRKGGLDFYPTTLEDWAIYEFPDELIETFSRSEKFSPEAIVTSRSIAQAALLFRWVEELEQLLRNMNLHHLIFPVLCIQNILSRTVYADKGLLAFIQLKYEMLCYQLNLQQAAAFQDKLRHFYGDVQVSLIEQAKWRLKITEESENSAANQDNSALVAEATTAVNQRAALARSNMFLQKIDSVPSSLKLLVDAAEIFITREDYQPARKFLWEAECIFRGLKEMTGYAELMPRCLYLQGVLAVKERRFLDAVTYLPKMESLDLSVDAETFCKAAILHSRALVEEGLILGDSNEEKVRIFLNSMIEKLNDMRSSHSNQKVWLEGLIALVELRLAEIDMEIAKSAYNKDKHIQIETIEYIWDKFLDCAEKLKLANYRFMTVEAIQLCLDAIIWHADCLADSQDSAEKNFRYHSLCKALLASQNLVQWGNTWLTEVMTVVPDVGTSFFQPSTASLQVQRLYVLTRVIASRTTTKLFDIRVDEIRQIRNEQEKKTAVLRAVEAFTEAKRDLSDEQAEWESQSAPFPDEIFTWLKGAFPFTTNTSYLKVQVLALLGKLSHLSAKLVAPDPPIQWEVTSRGISLESLSQKLVPESSRPPSSVNKSIAGGEDNISIGNESSATSQGERRVSLNLPDEVSMVDADGEQRQLTQMDINNLEIMMKTNSDALDKSKRYLAQACEYLQQAVTLSLKIGNRNICAEASLQLVEIFGQLEPSTTATYLMMFQNCSACMYLDELVWLSQPDTNASLQASLLNQVKNFEKYSVETNLLLSPLYRNAIKLLEQKSVAWRRLVPSQHQHELLRDFPPNMTFLVLQHSPDNRYLYAAIPERQLGKAPKENVSKKNQNAATVAALAAQQAAAAQATSARVARIEIGSRSKLESLLTNWGMADHRFGQVCLKHRYQADVVMKRQKMSATGDVETKQNENAPIQGSKEDIEEQSAGVETETEDAEDADAAERERELQALREEFAEQLEALDEYLEPILSQLLPSLRPLRTGSGNEKPSKGNKSPTQLPATQVHPSAVAPTTETVAPETLVVLADPFILEIPVEATTMIRKAPFAGIGRDFSAEIMWHRLKDDVSLEPSTGEEEQSKKKGNKLPSRVPALRELGNTKKAGATGTGGGKGGGINIARQLPNGVLPVDTHAFRYFIDVNQDYWPGEEEAPLSVYQVLVEKYGSSFQQKWVGVTGFDHTPSPGEWEAYIRDGASGFIYYGTEHISSALAPEKMGILGAPSLWLMMLFDMAQTPTSNSRQSKLDLEKSSTHLALEKPVSCAGLMTLAGFRSTLASRSMRSVNQQAQTTANVLNLLLGNGLTVGQTIRLLNIMNQDEIDRIINPPTTLPTSGDNTKQAKVDYTQTARQSLAIPEPVLDNITEDSVKDSPTSSKVPERHQFSMVCYGLPNLVITQMPSLNLAPH